MFIKDGKAIEQVVNEQFVCYRHVSDEEVPVLEFPLKFKWLGCPIPLTTIAEIVAFFRNVYARFKSEAQARLWFSPATGWRVQVLPQIVTGATTQETGSIDKVDFSGYTEVGTIHSHANFGASQSGTDEKDEKGTNGVHFTVGNVDSNTLSWHARAYYEGVEHEVDVASLIAIMPDGYGCLTEAALKQIPVLLDLSKVVYPPEWDAQISKPEVKAVIASSSWGKDKNSKYSVSADTWDLNAPLNTLEENHMEATFTGIDELDTDCLRLIDDLQKAVLDFLEQQSNSPQAYKVLKEAIKKARTADEAVDQCQELDEFLVETSEKWSEELRDIFWSELVRLA